MAVDSKRGGKRTMFAFILMGGEKFLCDSSLCLPRVRIFLGHREINTLEGNSKTGWGSVSIDIQPEYRKNSRSCWEGGISRTDGAIP